MSACEIRLLPGPGQEQEPRSRPGLHTITGESGGQPMRAVMQRLLVSCVEAAPPRRQQQRRRMQEAEAASISEQPEQKEARP